MSAIELNGGAAVAVIQAAGLPCDFVTTSEPGTDGSVKITTTIRTRHPCAVFFEDGKFMVYHQKGPNE